MRYGRNQGSPLATQMLELDNNVELHQTIEMPGIVHRDSAYSAAATFCLSSRQPEYSWESSYAAFDVAQGDVVTLVNEKLNLREIVRIYKKVEQLDSIRWVGTRFIPSIFAYYPEPDEELDYSEVLNLFLPRPSELEATYDDQNNRIDLTWECEDSVNVHAFQIQYRTIGGGFWTTIGNTNRDAREFRYIPEVGTLQHRFRVRSEGIDGSYSRWTSSNIVTVSFNLGPIIRLLAPGECPPSGEGTVGQDWISVSPEGNRRFIKGEDPWLTRVDETVPITGLNGQGVLYLETNADLTVSGDISTTGTATIRGARMEQSASIAVPDRCQAARFLGGEFPHLYSFRNVFQRHVRSQHGNRPRRSFGQRRIPARSGIGSGHRIPQRKIAILHGFGNRPKRNPTLGTPETRPAQMPSLQCKETAGWTF